ncbi:AraC family transcriptional regulator [Verrucomicrobiales bacterium BCK34]|nr:AraC family transcriptional regulator [Verrucomicrobiales bacterium BCK34]
MRNNVTYLGSAHIRFPKSLQIRPRRIRNHRFLFVESGNGDFIFPEKTLKLVGRTLLLLAPGMREIRYQSGRPVSYLYVEFSTPDELISGPFLECPATSPHFQTLVNLLRSVNQEKGKGVDHLIPAAIELALLHPAPTDRGATDPRIQRALNHIDSHLDRPLKISDLAEEAGLSLPHFRRLFQKTVATAPKEYLMRERMRYARKILQTEGLRVGEVADLMQFETVFQFSNQYKRVHGHSPVKDRPVG